MRLESCKSEIFMHKFNYPVDVWRTIVDYVRGKKIIHSSKYKVKFLLCVYRELPFEHLSD